MSWSCMTAVEGVGAYVTTLVAILLYLWYRYVTRNFGYWETQGVKSVKPRFLVGTMHHFWKKCPIEVEDERYNNLGRIYGSYEGTTGVLNIAEPDLIRLVFVKDRDVFVNRRRVACCLPEINFSLPFAQDDQWKRIRSIVRPSFTSGKIRKMNPLLVEATNNLIESLVSVSKSNTDVDIRRYFSGFTLDVIALCGFGVRIDAASNTKHPFIVNSENVFTREIPRILILTFILPYVPQFILRRLVSVRSIKFFLNLAKELMSRRIRERTEQTDLLQLMMDARAEADLDDHLTPTEQRRGTVSDLEIRSQIIAFILAGYETTAVVMTFMAYELALNPDIQQTLYQEIQEAYNRHSKIDYDVLKEMELLDAVLSETLRMHPVATRVTREASEDYVLGATGITVPKGARVSVPVYEMHHDPQWFPDPHKFLPDRFLPENSSLITPYTYLPFGVGPRSCVAMNFALLEIKLCFAFLLMKVKFVATDNTRKPLIYIPSPSVLNPKEILLRIERRQESSFE